MSLKLLEKIKIIRWVYETPALWPLRAKSWRTGKDSDVRRDWGQEEKGTTEDEMAGWHHWLDGRESEWTPGVGDGQGGLVCCSSWGHKESDTTERLNWTNMSISNSKRWCCESAVLNMPANLENSVVATELEKVSFHSNSEEKQCQRMSKLLHNCNHLTC